MDLSGTDLATSSRTEVVPNTVTSPPILRLRLQKKKSQKKVEWAGNTVDNEHMNKKKSKCCCIFHKQREFGESSSSDGEECENCFGHPEKRRKHRQNHQNNGSQIPIGPSEAGYCPIDEVPTSENPHGYKPELPIDLNQQSEP